MNPRSTPNSCWALGLASPSPAARAGPLPTLLLLLLLLFPPDEPPPLLPLLLLPRLLVTPCNEPLLPSLLLLLPPVLLPLVLLMMSRALVASEDRTASLLMAAAMADEALPCLDRACVCGRGGERWGALISQQRQPEHLTDRQIPCHPCQRCLLHRLPNQYHPPLNDWSQQPLEPATVWKHNASKAVSQRTM